MEEAWTKMTQLTFVVEEILTDYYDGIIIIKADSKEKAISEILEIVSTEVDKDRIYVSASDIEKIKTKIRELDDDEYIMLQGGQ